MEVSLETAEAAAAELARVRAEMLARVEQYLADSWQGAEALLASATDKENSLALFAIQRAYFGLYNLCMVACILLEIDMSRYQQNIKHYQDENAIPHSQLPVLVSDLLKVAYPAEGLKGFQGRIKQGFETSRILQKYRKRADYMGCEKVSVEHATECIEWAKALVKVIWDYTREHCN